MSEIWKAMERKERQDILDTLEREAMKVMGHIVTGDYATALTLDTKVYDFIYTHPIVECEKAQRGLAEYYAEVKRNYE
jgi:hypothetical protein